MLSSLPLKGSIIDGAMRYDNILMESVNIKLTFKKSCNLTSDILEKVKKFFEENSDKSWRA